MSMSKIQWTDVSWNPVVGCSRVSPGCQHCYAERMAWRLENNPQVPAYSGIAKKVGNEARWTGRVRLVEHKLNQPLRWRTPRRVFVNSMSDLFHDQLTPEDIRRVFFTMEMAQQHTFQVLTKRPENIYKALHHRYGVQGGVEGEFRWRSWPRNVWMGISTENQNELDRRWPVLESVARDFHIAVTFLSCEPLLGPLNLEMCLEEIDVGDEEHSAWTRPVDWVIVGGESGSRARPMDVDWVESIREQCQAAGVPLFVKQLGSRPYEWQRQLSYWPMDTERVLQPDGRIEIVLNHPQGGDPDEWPEDLQIREFPDA